MVLKEPFEEYAEDKLMATTVHNGRCIHEKGKLKVVSSGVIDGARFVEFGETNYGGLHHSKGLELEQARALRRFGRELRDVRIEDQWRSNNRVWRSIHGGSMLEYEEATTKKESVRSEHKGEMVEHGEVRVSNRARGVSNGAHLPQLPLLYAIVVVSGNAGGVRSEDGRRKMHTSVNAMWERDEHRAEGQSHTVFVDQLPESMHKEWLKQLFAPCGNITEVFIPLKRRLVSKSKYGFMRFRDEEAVKKAINMYNGVWCGNKKLSVKRA
ncbi:La-related protein 7 [Sarracenia purpurea var. burkii]